ncbi:hypothetical protein HK096_010710 [Nowakowskiella sp. JEL0078]|nr:hypothetical protein HK096_010710 [Nowakowskiella sp. JEL0078]
MGELPTSLDQQNYSQLPHIFTTSSQFKCQQHPTQTPGLKYLEIRKSNLKRQESWLVSNRNPKRVAVRDASITTTNIATMNTAKRITSISTDSIPIATQQVTQNPPMILYPQVTSTYKVEIYSDSTSTPTTTSLQPEQAIGIIVAAICAMLLAILIFLAIQRWRKQRIQKRDVEPPLGHEEFGMQNVDKVHRSHLKGPTSMDELIGHSMVHSNSRSVDGLSTVHSKNKSADSSFFHSKSKSIDGRSINSKSTLVDTSHSKGRSIDSLRSKSRSRAGSKAPTEYSSRPFDDNISYAIKDARENLPPIRLTISSTLITPPPLSPEANPGFTMQNNVSDSSFESSFREFILPANVVQTSVPDSPSFHLGSRVSTFDWGRRGLGRLRTEDAGRGSQRDSAMSGFTGRSGPSGFSMGSLQYEDAVS